jgi:hypothetical protein
MKRILPIALLFLLCVTTKAGSIITATITVTNTPSDGDTIIINGSTRTWKTTVATASSQISIGASIGANATNMFNQFAGTPFTTLMLRRSGTNGVTLRGIIDQTMSVSIAGTWGEYSLVTNTTTEGSQVMTPFSSYSSQSKATNIASQLVSDIGAYSTNEWSETATALGNYVSLTQSQVVENKDLQDSSIAGGTLSNMTAITVIVDRANGETNNGIYFYDDGGLIVSAIAPDDNGVPSLYIAESLEFPLISANAWGSNPQPENLLNYSMGDFRYGKIASANSWTGTNTFTQITNSAIINSTLTGSTYSGTIGTLTGGTVTSSTLTGSTYSGAIGTLSSGVITGAGITNATSTNIVLKGLSQLSGATAFNRANHTSMANGANAAVDFGSATFIKIKAGPTGAFSIAGIANGADGDFYILYNATGQNMTISNDSGTDPTPANRIYTGTGADIATTGNGAVTVVYDSEDSRWVVIQVRD